MNMLSMLKTLAHEKTVCMNQDDHRNSESFSRSLTGLV